MSKFTDLLGNFESEKRFLCIAEPYDLALASTVPHYFSSHGFVTEPGDTPPNTYFDGRLKEALEFKRSLFSNGKVSGRSIPGAGAIKLNNDDGVLDGLAGLAWSGRRVRVWLGGPDFTMADYGLIFDGTAQGIAYGDAEITINLRDLQYLFDREIQPLKFAGTGGGEGAADLADRRKPIALGVCRNVEPVYLGPDTGQHIFAVGDGPIVGVLRVLDRGVPLDFVAAAPTPGQWTVDCATGVVTLGGDYVGPVTADVIGKRYLSVTSSSSVTVGTGSKTFTVAAGQPLPIGAMVRVASAGAMNAVWMDGKVTGYSGTSLAIEVTEAAGSGTDDDWIISPWGTVAGIMKAIVDGYGVTNIDTAALTALNTLQPATVGHWIDQGGNGLDILDAITDGASCYYGFKRDGSFTAGRVDAPASPTASYATYQILDIDRGDVQDPAFEVVVKYRRNYAPANLKDIDGTAADGDKTFLTNEWRQTSASDAAIQTAFPLSDPIEMESIFDDADDAAAEATRLLALMGVPRGYFNVDLKVQPLALNNGDTVAIMHNRYGLDGGVNLVVLDLDEDLTDYQVRLGVWG
ncbi:MAG: hypothetical protein M9932_04135 [Xanthobacteraceae bacterium]|nr:hypothetical protein [Xanthobacteraceae bacterium]